MTACFSSLNFYQVTLVKGMVLNMTSFKKLCVSSYLHTTSSNHRYKWCASEYQFWAFCSALHAWNAVMIQVWRALALASESSQNVSLLQTVTVNSELFKCCGTLLTMKPSAALHFCTALSHGQLVRSVLDFSVFPWIVCSFGQGLLSCSVQSIKHKVCPEWKIVQLSWVKNSSIDCPLLAVFLISSYSYFP